ncbi:LIM domain containing protein [Trichuris trichiura]|uniref:LIM domain containing protein n=1 Tax=Trichuris trichiura TaxID=36087 RepID=A0A077Z7W8_TRITR|nr:LIM domain containing protein [Trichuris trichiura]
MKPDQNCHGCNNPFSGTNKFVVVGRFFFHEGCPKCDYCHKKIDNPDVNAQCLDDQVVCKAHIDNKELGANETCTTCGKEFTPLDKKIITIFGVRFHYRCVRCADCNAPVQENEWQGYKQRALCKQCYEKVKSVPCVKCRTILKEEEQNIVLQVGVICPNCFKCVECLKQLKPDDKFFQLNENVYCNACDMPFRRAKYVFDRTRGGPA